MSQFYICFMCRILCYIVGANRSQVIKLNLSLHIFEDVFGLHTNMSKNIIYLVNSVQNLAEPAGIMFCNIGSFPTTYLGLPLGTNFKANEIWSAIIEEFQKRLATWQFSIFLLEEELY